MIRLVKIVVEGLGFSYKSTQALKGLTFTVERGAFIGLVGPNGAGKTTLLRCLCNLLTPQVGTVSIDGVNLQQIPSQLLAKKVSVVLTTKIETPQMKVLDIMATSRHPHTGWMGLLKKIDLEQLDESMSISGIEGLVDRRFSELSDGQRQKVLFARALAQKPKVLLVDEPTAHLDVRHQIEVMQLLRRMSKEGLTIVAATHDLTLASAFCDTLILLKDGLIIDLGEPKKVLDSSNVAKAYDLEGVIVVDILGRHVIPKVARHMCGKNLKVHLICGGGTGLDILKALSELDIQVTAGVIHESDIDYYGALAVCDQVVAEKSYSPISEENFLASNKLIELSNIVIDSGFPIGPINKLNLNLLLKATSAGKRVLSLRSSLHPNVYGLLRDKVNFLNSPSQINGYVTQDSPSKEYSTVSDHSLDNKC